MTNEESKEVLGDVRAYLASRASLENEMIAGHTFIDICNAIKALEQEPKTGHWIRHDNGKYHWYLCSCCDAMAGSDEKMMAYKYCPNCGAEMRGDENGIET